MTREFGLALEGHGTPDGRLFAPDLLALVQAFREVTYRLTRAAASRAGLGRTTADVELLATVQVALPPQRTGLVLTVGDPDALEVDPYAAAVDEAWGQIVEGMAHARRPRGVSDSVAEAVDSLVVALRHAAPTAEIVVPGHGAWTLQTPTLSRDPWGVVGRTVPEHTVVGVLEMADSRTGRCRLRDAQGEPVELVEVVHPEASAQLITLWVQATGAFTPGHGTRHHRMEGARLVRATDSPTLPGLAVPGPTPGTRPTTAPSAPAGPGVTAAPSGLPRAGHEATDLLPLPLWEPRPDLPTAGGSRTDTGRPSGDAQRTPHHDGDRSTRYDVPLPLVVTGSGA